MSLIVKYYFILIFILPVLLGVIREFPKLKILTIKDPFDRLTTYIFVKLLPITVAFFGGNSIKNALGGPNQPLLSTTFMFVYSFVTYKLIWKIFVKKLEKAEVARYSEIWLTTVFSADILYSTSTVLLGLVLGGFS
jgi:hypothetical protein